MENRGKRSLLDLGIRIRARAEAKNWQRRPESTSSSGVSVELGELGHDPPQKRGEWVKWPSDTRPMPGQNEYLGGMPIAILTKATPCLLCETVEGRSRTSGKGEGVGTVR